MNKMNSKQWTVKVAKRAIKNALKMPPDIQILFRSLVIDLENNGPVQYEWPNYSKLTHERHHCHLNYRFVAVWILTDNEVRILEVTYVGSRKDAPY
jgi:mRNA-degrading endonuclease RelE of RelBE toxin-antitoxin system